MRIGIDMGHTLSGSGSGAIGIKKETDLNRAVGNIVIDKLKRLGHEIINCTVDYSNNDLSDRVSIANKNNVDLFVSIHFNYYDGNANGTEVYTYKAGLKANDYAQRVVDEITKLGFRNRGVKHNNYHVLRETRMEAILIECCFCDSANDMSKFNAESMANAIVFGLVGELPEEVKPQVQENNSGETLWRVVVGTYAVKENADNRVKELKDKGIDSFIVPYVR